MVKKKNWKDRVLKKKPKKERDAFFDSLPVTEEPLNLEKHCFICGWPLQTGKEAEDFIIELVAGVTYKYHPRCFEYGHDEVEKRIHVFASQPSEDF